ncbi:DUF333 domain-containing protein [Moraxella bovis]|uniref:DUF333 domain-containing protein n=1 Tax=Moraxella bovis TaxID=476 RepID=UPI002225BF70|nr:DUF333 domain-containing protein [Moraxella bovis]UYZ69238.1 DUF333 domain-containing protein [Moraxella bovis]UYZ71611.1 DUF333 domain-containing protein [Moraxella bovis]UYZ72475.1 DUF333 domain-containing protein [Moraxella bovis]UZA14906.1 DUF333 domain-containing protein [Moraxella bovis]UZA26732.1 DUF333 domain-containing protein [Moraxella bovis]
MKLLFSLTALLTLTACSISVTPTDVKVVGLSTPATEFCLQQKGFINPTTVNGKQVNICELPNGQKVEVNEFYKISGGSEQSHYTP